ncbi:MAG: hypothetical protein WAT66_09340 [Actinomycetota bacterium]
MTAVGWTLVGLAAGFLALALYGKYRILKDEYRQALEEESARRQAMNQEDPPASV